MSNRTGHDQNVEEPRMRRSRIAALTLATALGLGLAACSRDAAPALPQADRKKASTELQAGLTAQSKGDLDGAAQHYQESLKYDPKNKYALYNLALVDAANRDYGQAEKKYRVVLGIDPAYTPALFNLAILRKNSGDTTEATTLYRKLLAVNPKDAAAHMNLGILLRAAGHQAEGDAEVRQALTLNPQLKDPAAAGRRLP
jgi:tetratricopeptide (TPR) repeat protein